MTTPKTLLGLPVVETNDLPSLDGVELGWPALAGELRRRIESAKAILRRHNHPGCNTGAQTLAAAVLKALGAEEYAQ
jgi:hypothetical protein